MTDAQSRRSALAARMVSLAASLPGSDPLRAVGEASPTQRLKTASGWRQVGRSALEMVGARDTPVEPRLHHTLPPRADSSAVCFHLDLGPQASRAATDRSRRTTAEARLRELPGEAIWIWSDGSAEAGVSSGGGGALVTTPDGEERQIRVPAGQLCSSTRAELVALLAAVEAVLELPQRGGLPEVACLDSRAALLLLAGGAAAQSTPLGARLWDRLRQLEALAPVVHLQWVPAHCGLPGNERADRLAKEAAELPQHSAEVDARTLTRAVARAARKRWQEGWPRGWYRSIMGDHAPGPVCAATREEAVEVHQLRAGHWGRSEQYLHRIGRRPTNQCQQYSDAGCPAGLCLVCKEATDTPEHVLLHCPCLLGPRLRALGNINATERDMRRDDVVAALAAGYTAHKSRSASSPPRR